MSNYTRIHRYAFDGVFEKLKDLLMKFPDRVFESDKLYGRNVLHYCSIKGHYEIGKYILDNFNWVDNFNSLLSRKDNRGYTPLHYACLNGHCKLLSLFLIQEILDVNDKDNQDEKTPLHLCVENDHDECFRILLQYGGNPKIENREGLNIEEISQTKPMMKIQYESFLDRLFDIWEDRSQFNQKTKELERRQKQKAFPYFKFRLSTDLVPGIRLVIKRLLAIIDEGDDLLIEVCANFLTKTCESKWRNTLKTLVSFPNKSERFSYLTNEFFCRVRKKDDQQVSEISFHYSLLSFCRVGVEYSFSFIEEVFGTRSRNLTLFLLDELVDNNLVEVDHEKKVIKLNEYHTQLLSPKKKLVKPYLSSKFGVLSEEKEMEKFFSSSSTANEVNIMSSKVKEEESKQPKKGRKKKNKKKNKERACEEKVSPFEFEEIILSNDFFSNLSFSCGNRIALVIGNSKYESKKLEFGFGRNELDSVSVVSPQLIQNDCTSISCLLKNKFSFVVNHKKNLKGREINLEVYRILSLCKVLRRRNPGKSNILFIYFSGYFKTGQTCKFLGVDQKNDMDGKYIDLQRLFCEIEESQSHAFDFCYFLMNPISSSNGDHSRVPIGYGVPFQGFVGSNNNMKPTFDGCFSRFTKRFCRYMEKGLMDITQIFRKMRKGKLEVEFHSNFGNFSTKELILTPSSSQASTEVPGSPPKNRNRGGSSQLGEGSEITLEIPPKRVQIGVDESVLEKFENEIREVKKRKGKVGFVIYHSDFSPPYEFEEVMMERFRDAIENDFLCEEGCFKRSHDELEDWERNMEQIKSKMLLKNRGRLDHKKKKKKKKKKEERCTENELYCTPAKSSRVREIMYSSPFTPAQKVRSRHNSTMKSTGKRSVCSNTNESLSEVDLTSSDPCNCSILRYIWVNFPNMLLSSRIEKSKEIESIIQRIRKFETEILKLRDCFEPTPILLYVFRFFYVLFISQVEAGKNLFSTSTMEIIEESNKLDVDENEREEEKEGEKGIGESEMEEEDNNDQKKQEHSKKLWRRYSRFIWSEEFLEVLCNYDFQINDGGILDQLEEIYENMSKQENEISGKIEKLLFQIVKTWIDFLEYKYVQNGCYGSEKDREEYLKLVCKQNKEIIVLDGNRSMENGHISNRSLIESTTERMITFAKESISSLTNLLESVEFFCFLGVTDQQFLLNDFEFIPRDIPLLVGCSSSENRKLAEKKKNEVKGYLSCFDRILLVDVVEGRSEGEGETVYFDSDRIREEIVGKMNELKENEKKISEKWEMQRKRK